MLPLLFKFKETVQGSGYVAQVRMCGRATLEEEEGEVCIGGVAPAGFAGVGETRNEAFNDFRRGWAEILFGIAEESATFAEFKAACEDFLAQTHDEFTREWEEALQRVRDEQLSDDQLTSENADENQVAWQIDEITPKLTSPHANVYVGNDIRAAA